MGLKSRLGSGGEAVLAQAIGRAFMEMQKLEFAIVSYLEMVAGDTIGSETFDLFASKTFGNLLREMQKHEFLRTLASDMRNTKERRDFFVHKFLFHRYGGELFTTESEYGLLIREARELEDLFCRSQTEFNNLTLQKAPVVMFSAKTDPATGEWIISESEFSKGGGK